MLAAVFLQGSNPFVAMFKRAKVRRAKPGALVEVQCVEAALHVADTPYRRAVPGFLDVVFCVLLHDLRFGNTKRRKRLDVVFSFDSLWPSCLFLLFYLIYTIGVSVRIYLQS